MRLKVTMKLVKAMIEIEKNDEYLQNFNPSNIIITTNNNLFVIDFESDVTEDFYLEEEYINIHHNKVRFKVEMYELLMILRII